MSAVFDKVLKMWSLFQLLKIMSFFLTGLKAYNGQLEFYNVDELETMATAEHFMATDIDWDPTGRQVLNCLSYSFWVELLCCKKLIFLFGQVGNCRFLEFDSLQSLYILESGSILCLYSMYFDPLI